MLRFYIIALCSFFLDQATKFWIDWKIPYPSYPHQADGLLVEGTLGSSYEIVQNFFYIVHIGNKGAAWGMFQGYGIVLGALGLIATAAIIFFRKYLELNRLIPSVCFGLMTGGILGNVVDRFLHGHVIDFLDFWLPGYRWPAFNVADSAIVVGVLFYFVFSLREDYLQKKEKSTSEKDLHS